MVIGLALGQDCAHASKYAAKKQRVPSGAQSDFCGVYFI
jgi:hypothetical protein